MKTIETQADLWLWQYPELEPGVFHLMLGIAALVRGHEQPRQEYTDLLAAFVHTGLAAEMSRRLVATWDSIKGQQSKYAKFARRVRATGQTAQARPLAAATRALWDVLPAPTRDRVAQDPAIGQEYVALAEGFVTAYLGGSANGHAALGRIVMGVVFPNSPRATLAAVEADAIANALFAGDTTAKATERAARPEVSRVRSRAKTRGVRRQRLATLEGHAKVWADIRIRYGSDLDQALHGKYKSYLQPTLSKLVKPFNQAAGLCLPRGRKRNTAVEGVESVAEWEHKAKAAGARNMPTKERVWFRA